MRNNYKILSIQKKMKFYEGLYKKHLAGGVIVTKKSPNPNDEVCPKAQEGIE